MCRSMAQNTLGELVLLAIAIPIVLTASLPVAIIFLLCGPFYLLAAILGLAR